MPVVAGALDLGAVMGRLAAVRPVFHSEADFQHAFGQVVHDLDPGLQVRLEVRQDMAEYLDMLCFGRAGRTAIEFKYFTSSWEGSDPVSGEVFRLKSHAADDLARRNFVFDIERLERFCEASDTPTSGLAIMLTNHRALWAPPCAARSTRDREFRIHEGRHLTGTLEWAGGAFPANRRDLTGEYALAWRDFSLMDGPNGAFRWLVVEVAHQLA